MVLLSHVRDSQDYGRGLDDLSTLKVGAHLLDYRGMLKMQFGKFEYEVTKSFPIQFSCW